MWTRCVVLVGVVCGVWGGVGSGWAQTVVNQHCVIEWDAYVQGDPALWTQAVGLTLYIKKDGVQQPNLTMPLMVTSRTCKDLGVTTNGSYHMNLHAVDANGIESGPSNDLLFTLQVQLNPMTPPQNLRVTVGP